LIKERIVSEHLIDDVLGTTVDLREVGLREGLQSDPTILSMEHKVALFQGLVDAGCQEINAVSFVSPKRMPHMAGAEEMLRALGPARTGITISGLVPNDRGLDRALAMGEEGLLDTILLVFMDSEAGLAANGMTAGRDELLAQIGRSASAAAAAGLNVSVFISLAFGSSIDGWMDPSRVVASAAEINTMPGVSEIILSDSVGHADPRQVFELLTASAEVLPTAQRLGLHLHDTRGCAMANVLAALASPFQHLVLDAAFGGWGGDYPFIPEAFGNVAMEDLAEMLQAMGVKHGIDVEAIGAVTRSYAEISGRSIPAKLAEVGPVSWKRNRGSALTQA
jgi:hydroxymethylglutaryl-CoA lyase